MLKIRRALKNSGRKILFFNFLTSICLSSDLCLLEFVIKNWNKSVVISLEAQIKNVSKQMNIFRYKESFFINVSAVIVCNLT